MLKMLKEKEKNRNHFSNQKALSVTIKNIR